MTATVVRRTALTFLDCNRDPAANRTGERREAVFAWSCDCPDAVGLTFPNQPRWVGWVISRGLLAAGLDGPAGVGDVGVFPDLFDGLHVELILTCPQGWAGFLVPRWWLAEFLAATVQRGPASGEIFAADSAPPLKEQIQ